MDAIPDCVFVIDMTGVVRFANRAVENQLGYQVSDRIGRSILDLIHADDVAHVLSSIETVQGKEVGTPVEVRVRDNRGAWHWYEAVGATMVLDDGAPAIMCVARDITQRRMWEVAGNDLARLQQIIQVAPAIILLLDDLGVVSSVNAAFTRMLGHDQSTVIGRPLTSFIADGDEQAAESALIDLQTGGTRATFEARMKVVGQAQATCPVRFEMVSHLDDPVVRGIVISGYDVTELDAARQELEYLARHDTLTGLATRARLAKKLERLLASGQAFGVLFIDLDRFKPVNDAMGHDAGDEVLRLVGRRIEHFLRPLDMAARVGGDEFVVVLHEVDNLETAQAVAERIEEAVSAPYQIGSTSAHIGASIGIALAQECSTATSVLAEADMAMYRTKMAHRKTDASPAR